jgi:MoaA/NifB/PqqE/SkfB family radical SAM enzyme
MKILQKIERKLAKKRIPLSVTFEVTKKCNLNCIHCYVDHNDTDKELTIEEQKKIINQLYDLGVVYITFSGGELFVKKGVKELFKHTRDKKMGFKIITSATTLSHKDMDELKDLGIMEVGISIYSHDEKIHDKITSKKGSLRKSLQAAEYLNKIGVLTVSKTVIMEQNKNDIKNIYDLVKSYGMQPTFDMTLTDAENNVRNPKKYALSQKDITDIFKNKEFAEILLKSGSINNEYCNLKKNFLLMKIDVTWQRGQCG